ncbi:MAG: ABC transporter permease [Anaerolineaceae bacterium]|nr:ABC transporter permease [Anaerolineaceae bacterium]
MTIQNRQPETEKNSPTTTLISNANLLEEKMSHGKKKTNFSPLKLAFLRLWSNTLAVIGLAIVLIIILIAVAAPLIATHDPTYIDYNAVLQPPSGEHFFGTDDLGRDIFSRVVFGGRESLRVGFLGIIIAIFGGVIIGVITGYLGGWVDNLTQRLVEVFMAFPPILLILSIIAALGPNLTTVLIALGISAIPSFTRFVRGSVLAVKNEEYVTAAKVIGARNLRIMFRYVLPNILGPILVYGTLGLGSAIMVTAGLSYIGLGAQPPSPEWGAMLNYGRSYLRTAWWMSIYPGAAIFLVVLCINLFGDGLRDALDPKTRT